MNHDKLRIIGKDWYKIENWQKLSRGSKAIVLLLVKYGPMKDREIMNKGLAEYPNPTHAELDREFRWLRKARIAAN